MVSTAKQAKLQDPLPSLAADYRRVRDLTRELSSVLEPEDMVVQTMPDVSPTKWHLMHTSWFFEYLILAPHTPGHEAFDKRYDYFLNSYYYTIGQMWPRPQRGLMSRPTVAETLRYRAHVDEQMLALIDRSSQDADLMALVKVGIEHEQQHQELLLTDIKHVFSVNPLSPAYTDIPRAPEGEAVELEFIAGTDGRVTIGTSLYDGDFCFDNEAPLHEALLRPHAIANRPVTNAEYRAFIEDRGYSTPDHWLSDGWAAIQQQQWDRPQYWSEDLDSEFTLGGWRELQANAPVSHVSYYEAYAFAHWAGARLPTEFEWESATDGIAVEGNFLESGLLHPAPPAASDSGFRQMFGDVWEWTSSAYLPYPGFKPFDGSLGEYNGKFMNSQMVTRGGSCAAVCEHVRATYRNFFYPHQRWQFFGFRLAQDR